MTSAERDFARVRDAILAGWFSVNETWRLHSVDNEATNPFKNLNNNEAIQLQHAVERAYERAGLRIDNNWTEMWFRNEGKSRWTFCPKRPSDE